jgi:polysaccharide export outer membrane protein
VRTPGLYPFRYGATALSAVAIAGGFGPSELIRSTAVSEFLAADQTLRQLTFQHRTLLARRARLEAQRDGKESFSTPALGDPAQASIVANEKDMFLTQATILQNQLYLLQSQKPRLERQIEAHKEGIAAGNKQLALIKEQVDRYRGLVKQGLGTQTAAFQFSVLEANQESTIWRLAAEISRLEMDAGELDLKIQDAEASFKRQVATELHDVRERLNEMDVTLPAARQIRDVKLRYAGGDVIKHSISITRVQNGKPVVLDATETTSLEPGDIVNIEPLFPRDSPAYGSAELPDLQRSQTVTAESPTGLVPR